jgi:CheY-like chemotaxis protein
VAASRHHGRTADRRVRGSDASTLEPLVVLTLYNDDLTLMRMVAMLKDVAHTAQLADTGRQALEFLNGGGHLDLVIVDQATPKRTGAQLAEAIKAEWPTLPVILATGCA